MAIAARRNSATPCIESSATSEQIGNAPRSVIAQVSTTIVSKRSISIVDTTEAQCQYIQWKSTPARVCSCRTRCSKCVSLGEEIGILRQRHSFAAFINRFRLSENWESTAPLSRATEKQLQLRGTNRRITLLFKVCAVFRTKELRNEHPCARRHAIDGERNRVFFVVLTRETNVHEICITLFCLPNSRRARVRISLR